MTERHVESAVMSVEEAAEILGVSRNTAYEAVKRGEIPTMRIGRLIKVLRRPFMRMVGADRDQVA